MVDGDDKPTDAFVCRCQYSYGHFGFQIVVRNSKTFYLTVLSHPFISTFGPAALQTNETNAIGD